MVNLALLRQLADGEFHSGQLLADAFGVSRTAIWKQISQLGELGVPVERERSRGYRIPGGLELLDAARLTAQLSRNTRALLHELRVLPEVDSTNAELQRIQAPAGTVCVAECQTAGRGRRGRTWISPFARNLYCSLVWSFDGGAAALEGLSLAVGVLTARALEQLGVGGVRLKWPNDLLVDGAKLGGILLEMSGDAAGRCEVVIGIGINVSMPIQLASHIDQAWTQVAQHVANADSLRQRLLLALLEQLLPGLRVFAQQGFPAFRTEWCARDAFAGRPVQILGGGPPQRGIARGVDARGALQLETSEGLQSIWAGDVSLRGANED